MLFYYTAKETFTKVKDEDVQEEVHISGNLAIDEQALEPQKGIFDGILLNFV